MIRGSPAYTTPAYMPIGDCNNGMLGIGKIMQHNFTIFAKLRCKKLNKGNIIAYRHTFLVL